MPHLVIKVHVKDSVSHFVFVLRRKSEKDSGRNGESSRSWFWLEPFICILYVKCFSNIWYIYIYMYLSVSTNLNIHVSTSISRTRGNPGSCPSEILGALAASKNPKKMRIISKRPWETRNPVGQKKQPRNKWLEINKGFTGVEFQPESYLVGGWTTPSEKICSSKWIISIDRDEHKTCLKPPIRKSWAILEDHLFTGNNLP